MPTSAFRFIKISHKTWQNNKKLKDGSLFGVVRTKNYCGKLSLITFIRYLPHSVQEHYTCGLKAPSNDVSTELT